MRWINCTRNLNVNSRWPVKTKINIDNNKLSRKFPCKHGFKIAYSKMYSITILFTSSPRNWQTIVTITFCILLLIFRMFAPVWYENTTLWLLLYCCHFVFRHSDSRRLSSCESTVPELRSPSSPAQQPQRSDGGQYKSCSFTPTFLAFRDHLHIFVGQSSTSFSCTVCFQSCQLSFHICSYLPGCWRAISV